MKKNPQIHTTLSRLSILFERSFVQLYEKDGFMMQFRFLTSKPATYQPHIIEAVKSLQLVKRELRKKYIDGCPVQAMSTRDDNWVSENRITGLSQ